MTTQQYIEKLQRSLSGIEKGFAVAVSTTHTQQVRRIFENGEKADGSKIGNYVTGGNPYYTKGKKYASYADYRKARGRQTGFVDLKLEGILQSDYRSSLAAEGPYKWVTGLKNAANIGKAEGAEDRYGDIFSLSQSEKDTLVNTAQYEFKKAMS